MTILINALLFVAAFVGMEVVAYLAHKFVMHGPLWSLHRSHHVPHDHALERNDWFGVFFALPSIVLIWVGTNVYAPALWIGLGMTAYGAAYFIFHDVIVHRRLKVPYKPAGGYLQRITQAHRMHHATRERDGAVSFGFLYAPTLDRLKARREAARESATGRREA
jgi:beta-carotene 3-hydroxylase